MDWFVYIIETEQGTLYTGITTDLQRRFGEHSGGKKGAKYFRVNKPMKIVFVEKHGNRSLATKREIMIKKLSKTRKIELIESSSSNTQGMNF